MTMTSQQHFEAAQQYIVGGVNSPVRAFRGVGGSPIFFERGQGAYLFDVEGKQYIDYVGSWGPMIAGHAHPSIVKAVQQAAEKGLSFGAPTPLETEMARRICELVPSIELLRMVSSGTEATMSAIRLARGYTGRDKIIKFVGCYHGHVDSLLVKAGSGVLTLGLPNSPGVPASLAEHTLTLEYNNITQLNEVFNAMGEQIAGVIVEPVAGNMNLVAPIANFLETLRALCTKHGSVLIFDEVMTGFRVAKGGAQAYYNITPDLTTLGKVIGGGMPVGAFGGKREIMSHIAPLGSVYQAGTLSGNPVAMAAGLANLDILCAPNFYENLTKMTVRLVEGLKEQARLAGIPFQAKSIGGMFGIFFTENNCLETFEQVGQCNVERFKSFFHAMLQRGVYLAPSAFEAGFVSAAHTEKEIDETIRLAGEVFKTL